MIITYIIERTDEEVYLYNAVEMIKAHIVLTSPCTYFVFNLHHV